MTHRYQIISPERPAKPSVRAMLKASVAAARKADRAKAARLLKRAA